MTQSICSVGKVGLVLLVAVFVATTGCVHHRSGRSVRAVVVVPVPSVDVHVHVP